MTKGTAAKLAMIALGMAAVVPAMAQQPGQRPTQRFGGAVTGTVSSVQGDTIQVQTMDAREPVTVKLTAESRVVRRESLKPTDLKVGDKVTVMGMQSEGAALQAFRITAGDAATLGRGLGTRAGGGQGNRGGGGAAAGPGRGGFRPLSGTIKSTQPLVITNDQGQDVTVEVTDRTQIDRAQVLTRDALKQGEEIRAFGQRQDDGSVNATMVEVGIDPQPRVGTVRSAGNGVLVLTPRSGTGEIRIPLTAETRIVRQQTLEPSELKVGDKVTVVARQRAGAAGDLIASSILLGEPPQMAGGARGGFGGGGAAFGPGARGAGGNRPGGGEGTASQNRPRSQRLTGEITKLSPLTVKTATGDVELTVSGQTRVLKYATVTADQIPTGETVRVDVKRGPNGALVADTVAVGVNVGGGRASGQNGARSTGQNGTRARRQPAGAATL